MTFRIASDRALYACIPAHQSLALLKHFENAPFDGLVNLHPAYESLLVVFDPIQTTHAAVQQTIQAAAHLVESAPSPDPQCIDIPVHYGGAAGPDLADVAAHHGISPERVVEIHTAAVYKVDFLGFVPGFAYMSGLSTEIATPRLSQPRTHVPAGSVGLAGAQTGVYPFITPGGWRLIGRTDTLIFDPSRQGMSLLHMGDRVRFVAR